jgi:hypothetical protein
MALSAGAANEMLAFMRTGKPMSGINIKTLIDEGRP